MIIEKEKIDKVFAPKKWLKLESVLMTLNELNTTLQLSVYGADALGDTESLPLVISLACNRLNEVQNDIKKSMEEWQASANYLD